MFMKERIRSDADNYFEDIYHILKVLVLRQSCYMCQILTKSIIMTMSKLSSYYVTGKATMFMKESYT